MAKKWPDLVKFKPKNPHKYVGDVNDITTRSSWEITFCRYCDNNPSILKWNSEDIRIPYWSSADNKERTYHVDFIITVKTKTGTETMLIEIKPYTQTLKPVKKQGKKLESYVNEMHTYQVNIDKWTHAKKYAEQRGMKFMILTENELYGGKHDKNAG